MAIHKKGRGAPPDHDGDGVPYEGTKNPRNLSPKRGSGGGHAGRSAAAQRGSATTQAHAPGTPPRRSQQPGALVPLPGDRFPAPQNQNPGNQRPGALVPVPGERQEAPPEVAGNDFGGFLDHYRTGANARPTSMGAQISRLASGQVPGGSGPPEPSPIPAGEQISQGTPQYFPLAGGLAPAHNPTGDFGGFLDHYRTGPTTPGAGSAAGNPPQQPGNDFGGFLDHYRTGPSVPNLTQGLQSEQALSSSGTTTFGTQQQQPPQPGQSPDLQGMFQPPQQVPQGTPQYFPLALGLAIGENQQNQPVPGAEFFPPPPGAQAQANPFDQMQPPANVPQGNPLQAGVQQNQANPFDLMQPPPGANIPQGGNPVGNAAQENQAPRNRLQEMIDRFGFNPFNPNNPSTLPRGRRQPQPQQQPPQQPPASPTAPGPIPPQPPGIRIAQGLETAFRGAGVFGQGDMAPEGVRGAPLGRPPGPNPVIGQAPALRRQAEAQQQREARQAKQRRQQARAQGPNQRRQGVRQAQQFQRQLQAARQYQLQAAEQFRRNRESAQNAARQAEQDAFNRAVTLAKLQRDNPQMVQAPPVGVPPNFVPLDRGRGFLQNTPAPPANSIANIQATRARAEYNRQRALGQKAIPEPDAPPPVPGLENKLGYQAMVSPPKPKPKVETKPKPKPKAKAKPKPKPKPKKKK